MKSVVFLMLRSQFLYSAAIVIYNFFINNTKKLKLKLATFLTHMQ